MNSLCLSLANDLWIHAWVTQSLTQQAMVETDGNNGSTCVVHTSYSLDACGRSWHDISFSLSSCLSSYSNIYVYVFMWSSKLQARAGKESTRRIKNETFGFTEPQSPRESTEQLGLVMLLFQAFPGIVNTRPSSLEDMCSLSFLFVAIFFFYLSSRSLFAFFFCLFLFFRFGVC